MPSPISDDQRQEVLSLLRSGVTTKDIAAQTGVSLGQAAAIKAWITMGKYGDDSDAEIVAETASAVDTAFGLERDLQMALRRNIEQLEPGLTVMDGGKEQVVASGRIDITARSKDGTAIVMELKAGEADRDAIGQVLAYMGDLLEREKVVRGIIVAREFSPRAIAAARATANVSLIRYGVRFSFEPVLKGRSQTGRGPG